MIIETGVALNPSTAAQAMLDSTEKQHEKIYKRLLTDNGMVVILSSFSRRLPNSTLNKSYRTIAGLKPFVKKLQELGFGRLDKGHFHLASETAAISSTKTVVYVLDISYSTANIYCRFVRTSPNKLTSKQESFMVNNGVSKLDYEKAFLATSKDAIHKDMLFVGSVCVGSSVILLLFGGIKTRY